MSYLAIAPETVATAAADLAGIGSALDAANTAAANSTTSILVSGQDEVSVAIAKLFGAYGRQYQLISAQAAAFHTQFVHSLGVAGDAYAAAEAANVSPLQSLDQAVQDAINAPTQLFLGRALIGNGADGTPGTGQNGAPGGLLFGNGGRGGCLLYTSPSPRDS